MRILYVEDNEVNQALVERVMRARQCSVVFQDEGEGALEALAIDSTIDLILLDIELAGTMTGLDVIRAIRARNDHRPVVAVTAYAMMGDRERILEAGCDQYLPKPLVVTDLLNVIDHYQNELAAKPKPAAEIPAAKPAPAAPSPAAETPAPTPSATPAPVPTSAVAATAEPGKPAQPDETKPTEIAPDKAPVYAAPTETAPASSAKTPGTAANGSPAVKSASDAASAPAPSEVAQKADQELPVEDSR